MDYPTQEEIEGVAKSVFDKAIEKIKAEITDNYYNEITSYLYEHFSNFNDRVRRDMIEKLAEEFGSDPSKYEYAKIRKSAYESHKDEILASLTKEVIESGISKAMKGYCDEAYHYSWQWKDEIAKFIIGNKYLFLDDERINAKFLRELQNKDEYIESLKRQIQET